MKLNKFLLAGLLCGAPIAASAQINIGINIGGPVRMAPPPPLAENYGFAPGPGYVWIGGHWAWHHRWIWIRGHWDSRPGYLWAPGHWDQSGGGYVWVEGQWAPAGLPPIVAGPAGGTVIVQQAPPPLIVEDYGPAPGPDFFWIGGRWAWNGRWVWTRGHWDRHPHWHPGGGWIAGHWDHRSNGYVWVEGRWR